MALNIYQYYAEQSDGFRYSYSTNPDLSDGWTKDGVVFKVPSTHANGRVPVYQYHYDQNKTYGGWRYLYSVD